MPDHDRDHDLILYGATGFTGKLVAQHLLARTAGTDLRWAIAGRTESKLRQVAEDIGAPDLPVIIADAGDADALAAMAASTSTVCSTVGPYASFGSPVVAACAEAGTDYCDLTGEIQWIRRMIDQHADRARQTGARIVHTCGFDSIPSDMGTWFAQQQMHERHGVHSPRVSMRVKGLRGGASGGTIASLMAVMEEAGSDPETRRIVRDPYALLPEGERTGPKVSDVITPRHDADFGQWIGPFVMAVVNARVVRRSNALLGYPWGRDFRYDEAILTGPGPIGAVASGVLTGGMGLGTAAMAVGPLRQLAGRFLPGSGEGPAAEARERGWFDIRLLAQHPTDRALDVRVQVVGDRDPGYGSTPRMLGESALCLAADEPTVEGGMWTPASALGQPLLDRLQAHAGVTFTALD